MAAALALSQLGIRVTLLEQAEHIGEIGAGIQLAPNAFAALDAPSSRCLAALLTQAAQGERRAWLVADYGRPPLLAGVPLAAVLDLDQPAR